MTERKIQLTDGSPVPEDRSHTAIDSLTGQQRGYVVLSPEERAKGFKKPVRRSYRHIGPPPAPTNLRDLTPEELAEHGKYGYIKFEPYPPGQLPLTGKYWSQKEIDRAGTICGRVTTMGRALAETYATDPTFYSGTFCCDCGAHFDLSEFEWEDGEPMDVSKQSEWAAQQKQRRAEARRQRIEQLRREIAELEAQTD